MNHNRGIRPPADARGAPFQSVVRTDRPAGRIVDKNISGADVNPIVAIGAVTREKSALAPAGGCCVGAWRNLGFRAASAQP